MKSNYKRLGDYIRQVDIRNKDEKVTRLLGVSIDKKFIESIANTIGTDMSVYKIVKHGQFAYGPVTSRNGDKVSIALLTEEECIISSSYTVFEVTDTKKLLPEYLNLWFKRPEFDRYARFHSHGSAREIFDWEEMCNVELPVPPIEEQEKIVDAYQKIETRIALKKKINENLEKQAFSFYRHIFEENKLLNIQNGWQTFSISYFAPIITGKKDVNITNITGKYPFFSCSQDFLLTDAYSFDGNAVLVAGNGDFNIKWYCGKFEAYQRTYVLMPTEKSNYALLYYALKYHLPQAVNSARGSVISFITKGILEDIKVTIPMDIALLNNYCNVLNNFNHSIDINKKSILKCGKFLQILLSNMV